MPPAPVVSLSPGSAAASISTQTSMTVREMLLLRSADRATTKKLLDRAGTARLIWSVSLAVLLAVVLFVTLSFGDGMLVVLGLVVVTLPVSAWQAVRGFRSGRRVPPPGLYRVGFGPKRRFDGTRWGD